MLKIVALPFLILLVMNSSDYGQEKQMERNRPYVLTSELVKSRQDLNLNTQKEFRLELLLHHKLLNNSDNDLLLWKGEDAVFNPLYVGQTISTSEKFEDENTLLDRVGGESIALGSKWEGFRKQLDAPTPPSEAILVIKPNEFVLFESRVFLLGRKPFRGMTGGDINLDRLKELQGVWLKVKFQVWSRNLTTNTTGQQKPLFGERLRERWRPFGCLLLEDIVTEPIYVELDMPGSGT